MSHASSLLPLAGFSLGNESIEGRGPALLVLVSPLDFPSCSCNSRGQFWGLQKGCLFLRVGLLKREPTVESLDAVGALGKPSETPEQLLSHDAVSTPGAGGLALVLYSSGAVRHPREGSPLN